jgi:ectoine hydroxylase-related dioxygenase (phytanoyl-CoA dioxygenase family)
VSRGLTARQRRQFDEAGFLVFENVLTAAELRTLNRAADLMYARHGGDRTTGRLELRDCVTHHPAFLQMVDHRALLPAVLELLGPDIKIRTSELDIRPPLRRRRPGAELGRARWGEPEQWHIDGPIYGYPSVGGIVPMMEVRAGYYLTDLRPPDAGALCLVPGSHRLDYRHLADPRLTIDERAVTRLDVAPGSAVLFRTGVWHCTSPNLSSCTRKVLYLAYTYRWIHGSDHVERSRKLLQRCSPIQRQLLGAPVRPRRHPLGSQPARTPRSLFWFTEPCDLPVLALARERASTRRRQHR